MNLALQGLVVYASVFAADYAWTKYNMHSAAKHPHLAGVWSAAIIGFGAISVVSYTTNHWLLIPALVGAYTGTFVAVRRG